MPPCPTCLYCQASIPQRDRGRKRSFCSGKCKTAYHRQVQRAAQDLAQELELRRLVHTSTQDQARLVRGVMPATSDFVLEVLARYGLKAAQLVAQGVQIENEARKAAKKTYAGPVVVEAQG